MNHVWFVEVKIGKVWNPIGDAKASRSIARHLEAYYKRNSNTGYYRVRKYVREEK